MLRESHLACHTFPEYGSICLNLFCCRPRAEYDFAGELARRLGADSVRVRLIERPYQP
jgi:S-adenosylmethionine decarboxylase